jgi:hypothetical protein
MAAYRVRESDGKVRATGQGAQRVSRVAGFTASRVGDCFRVEQPLLQRAWSACVS